LPDCGGIEQRAYHSDEYLEKLMRIVVTGANGFVGRPVCRKLASDGHEVVALTRREPEFEVVGTRHVTFAGGLNDALTGADVLVHLAARAHVLDGK
jgi:UDP-glucose 4-epimerase